MTFDVKITCNADTLVIAYQVRRQSSVDGYKGHHAICRKYRSRETCTPHSRREALLYSSWCRSLQTLSRKRWTSSRRMWSYDPGQYAVQLSRNNFCFGD